MRLLVLLVSWWALSPAWAGEITVAVAHFDNNTGDSAYDALGRGLADMLVTDLSGLPELKVVERARLAALLDELALADSAFVDPASAAKLGKGLGATHIVVGAFAAIEPELRIDARVVSVETGEVAAATHVTGPKQEFFLLEKELALGIAEQVGVKLAIRDQARLASQVPTESFEAFRDWSAGLEAFDRGDLETARQRLDAALAADDGFIAARGLLDGLEERLTASLATGDVRAEEDAAGVLTHLGTMGDGPWDSLSTLLPPARPFTDRGSATTWREVADTLLAMPLPESLKIPYGPEPMSVTEWALAVHAVTSQTLGDCHAVVLSGDAYVSRYPSGVWTDPLASLVRACAARVSKSQAGLGEVEAIEARAARSVHRMRCRGDTGGPRRIDACMAWIDAAEAGGTADELDEALDKLTTMLRRGGDRDRLAALGTRFPTNTDVQGEIDDLSRRWKDLPATTVADHEDADDLLDHVKQLERFGRYPEAIELLIAGRKTWPDVALHDALGKARAHLDDLAGIDADLAAADSEPARATLEAHRTEMLEEQANWVGVPGTAMMRQAQELFEAGQYAAAGALRLRLAAEFPQIQAPAASVVQACVVFHQGGLMAEARAACQRVVDEYPESSHMSMAQQLLRTLPR